MRLRQLSLFTLTFVVAGVLAGCAGGSSSAPQPATPAPVPTVDPSSYDDAPGQFSSLYTGTCVIKTPDRTYTNCSTRVRIEQKPYMIFIRTQFFINPSSRTGDSPKVVRHEQTYSISGKALSTGPGQPQIGMIGREGFYVTLKGQTYHFVRLYPNNYEYAGTFIDDSGRSVEVTGRVGRGSVIEASFHRTRK